MHLFIEGSNLKVNLSDTIICPPFFQNTHILDHVHFFKQFQNNWHRYFLIPFLEISLLNRKIHNQESPYIAWIQEIEQLKNCTIYILDAHAPHILKNTKCVHTINPITYLRQFLKNIVDHNSIFIAPDQGALAKVKKLSRIFQIPYLSLLKKQDSKDLFCLNKIKNLNNKKAIIIDDLIKSGRTIQNTIHFLLDNNITQIYIYATHFLHNDAVLEILNHKECVQLIVTNSTGIKYQHHPKLKILTLCKSQTVT